MGKKNNWLLFLYLTVHWSGVRLILLSPQVLRGLDLQSVEDIFKSDPSHYELFIMLYKVILTFESVNTMC